MSEKIPCVKCGALILPATAARTGGVCMPCKQGIRKNIESSKRYYEEQKKYDPYRELWVSLVRRVHKTDAGFDGLTTDEKLYYAVSVLVGEVYNGGFEQFFHNSSGGMFRDAAAGLELLGAYRSLELLLQATRAAFQEDQPSVDWDERRALLKASEDESRTSALDIAARAFWKDPDKLTEKLTRFATERGLITPFLK